MCELSMEHNWLSSSDLDPTPQITLNLYLKSDILKVFKKWGKGVPKLQNIVPVPSISEEHLLF